MKKTNDVQNLQPLFKNVYPDKSVGYLKNKKEKKNRFRKIRKILREQKESGY